MLPVFWPPRPRPARLPVQPESARMEPTPPLRRNRAHAEDTRVSTRGMQVQLQPAMPPHRHRRRLPLPRRRHPNLRLRLQQRLPHLQQRPSLRARPPVQPRLLLPVVAQAWCGSTLLQTCITATAERTTVPLKQASTCLKRTQRRRARVLRADKPARSKLLSADYNSSTSSVPLRLRAEWDFFFVSGPGPSQFAGERVFLLHLRQCVFQDVQRNRCFFL